MMNISIYLWSFYGSRTKTCQHFLWRCKISGCHLLASSYLLSIHFPILFVGASYFLKMFVNIKKLTSVVSLHHITNVTLHLWPLFFSSLFVRCWWSCLFSSSWSMETGQGGVGEESHPGDGGASCSDPEGVPGEGQEGGGGGEEESPGGSQTGRHGLLS